MNNKDIPAVRTMLPAPECPIEYANDFVYLTLSVFISNVLIKYMLLICLQYFVMITMELVGFMRSGTEGFW